MNEEKKYETIKELVLHGGNKNRVALKLGCTIRTVNRHIAGYKAEGKGYFMHGNKSHSPVHALSKEEKQDILDLYRNKFFGANFSHFSELLMEKEGICISEGTIRKIFKAADIVSPLANRKTKRELKKKLEAELVTTKKKKDTAHIKTKLLELEDVHPMRPRRSNFGEMIQMDASLHLWFGDEKITLHLAVDDATGIIVGAWFDKQETLCGYYHVLYQILIHYGIPYMFYTDKRTVFEYRKSGSKEIAEDSSTQFGYACKTLGIEIKTTSVPQAKGRVERLNASLQSRLPVELRLEGVTTIEQANEYLPGFIAKYNARFALNSDCMPSVFEKQPSQEEIYMILAVLTQRTVDGGCAIRFENNFYKTVNKSGLAVYLPKGTKGLVIKTFNNNLFFSCSERLFSLQQIPTHERYSKNFDITPPMNEEPKKPYIPKPNHPWRLSSFSAFVKQKHKHA